MRWILQYVVAAVLLWFAILLWPRVVDQEDRLGSLLDEGSTVLAGGAFYALFVAALVFFVVDPAIRARSVVRAVLTGAVVGVVVYGVWNLTDLQPSGFPERLMLVDLAWAVVVGAVVSGLTCAVLSPWFNRRGARPAREPARHRE